MLSITAICHPPLGQATVLKSGTDHVEFNVILQSNVELSDAAEVELFHNCAASQEWTSLRLSKDTGNDALVCLNGDAGEQRSAHRGHYSGAIHRGPSGALVAFEFTLKYRAGLDRPWTWANDVAPVGNGEILPQAPDSLPGAIRDCLVGLDPAIHVAERASEAVDTRLWALTMPVAGARGDDAGSAGGTLGAPVGAARWCALVRQWAAWLAPRQGRGLFFAEEDALTVSFLRRDGLHLVLLGASGVEDGVTTLLRGDGDGNVLLAARNDAPQRAEAMVLAAVGYEQETAMAACMYHARRLVQSPATEGLLTAAGDQQKQNVQATWMEEWWDGLGYSTWNALGLGLTENKIIEALDDLAGKDIQISNLFIDDGWQSVDPPGHKHSSGWKEFEANKTAFPIGLAGAVTKIRENFPSVEHIAVWHALLGYWNGIAPSGPIARNYETQTVHKKDTPKLPPGDTCVVHGSDAERLYDDFYAFLARSGVDGVKADVQCPPDLLAPALARHALTRAYQDAWTRASLLHLSGRATACMAHVPATLFRTHLPTTRPPMLLRTSDDFFPDAPAAAHGWHVFANAAIAGFARFLNVVPDWDMFQTGHAWGAFHAAARSLSGGPVVITDEPGKVDATVLLQCVAMTVMGKSVALRPSTPGKAAPSCVYQAHHDPRLLKIGAYHGSTDTGSGFLGVFNVGEGLLSELVLLNEIPGLLEDQIYVMQAYTSNTVLKPIRFTKSRLLPLTLSPGSWEILSAHPVTQVSANLDQINVAGGPQIAVLGLIDKMTGGAAVLRWAIKTGWPQRLQVSATLKALGKLGIYFDWPVATRPSLSMLVLIQSQVIPKHTVSGPTGSVVQVDLERAWREMKLEPGYSNELTVDAFFSLE